MVSRYAICGLPALASTLNSRNIRSRMISRCNSPMPAMIVWPVSSLVKRGKSDLLRRGAGGLRHFFLVRLGLRLDGHRDNRLRERRRFEQDRVIFVAERVAGRDILHADDRGDIAGVTGLDILAFVRLDLDQAADALALVRARIVNRVALRHCRSKRGRKRACRRTDRSKA